MQEHWTYPSSPQSANFPLINLPPLNTTLPLPTASSTMLHPTPTPTKPSTPLPWLSGPSPTPASCSSQPKSGSVAGCSVGLGDPPPYLLNPPPKSHRQSWKDKQSLVCASRLLQSRLLCNSTPCHPQRPPPCLVPAHTRGGSVCGRGGVCYRFWRWTSVGRAHAHPNQPWPPSTVSYSSTTNARLVLRLPRLDRISPSQVNRHASRLDQGEGRSELLSSCLPSWPILSTPQTSSPKSCLSTATSKPYPSFTAPPIILYLHTFFPTHPSPPHNLTTTVAVAAMQSAIGTHLP
jgi:hypothetical protein